MENTSALNILEQMIRDYKVKSLGLLIGEHSKKITSSNCDNILQMINELKEAEKEQSRLDWKAGYIKSCFDVQEFFNGAEEPYLKDSDLALIDQESVEYVNEKFK